MKILILEYITGGGLIKEAIPPSLAREGGLMLRALLDDLAEIDGIELTVLRDARLEPLLIDKHTLHTWLELNPGDDFGCVWKSAIQEVDAVWPVAPETGGILEKLCREVKDGGKILLNSSAKVVSLTAAKRETLQHLNQAGLDIVPTLPLSDFDEQFEGPWVVKPNDGVGCEGIRLVRELQEIRRLQTVSSTTQEIIQPFIKGDTMSLSVLFKRGNALLLCCNRQTIKVNDDTFYLSGCTVNILPNQREMFIALADRIAGALPELFGYVGIDIVVSDKSIRVLEINPRLTSSYAGISAALNRNIAEMVLNLAKPGGNLPSINGSTGSTVSVTLGGDCVN